MTLQRSLHKEVLFLKKGGARPARTKKLLRRAPAAHYVQPAMNQKSFASFLQKRRPSFPQNL
jgi:hypothetical protein